MTLEELAAKIDRLTALVTQALSEKKTGMVSGATVAAIAPDSDLDSQWGDPEVRKDSPQWLKQGGESYAGRRFSECPSDYRLTWSCCASTRLGQARPRDAEGSDPR